MSVRNYIDDFDSLFFSKEKPTNKFYVMAQGAGYVLARGLLVSPVIAIAGAVEPVKQAFLTQSDETIGAAVGFGAMAFLITASVGTLIGFAHDLRRNFDIPANPPKLDL